MDRREFVLTAALAGAGVAALSACGGGGGPRPAQASADTQAWNIFPEPALMVGETGVTFDLKKSLPNGVRQGGRFTVSPTGQPLPVGVVLSPSGVLVLTSAASARITAGVVFAYDEPSS